MSERATIHVIQVSGLAVHLTRNVISTLAPALIRNIDIDSDAQAVDWNYYGAGRSFVLSLPVLW
jgi:hypothetical protein